MVAPHPVAVANPDALIVATLAVLDVHVAVEVTSVGDMWESFEVPMAVNCVVWPTAATLGFCGVSAMETM